MGIRQTLLSHLEPPEPRQRPPAAEPARSPAGPALGPAGPAPWAAAGEGPSYSPTLKPETPGDRHKPARH